MTHSERDGVPDAGEILERFFEIVVVPCKIEPAAMTNDDGSDVTGEGGVLSDVDQSLQPFRRYVVGAIFEESHREAISCDDVEDLGRKPDVQEVLISDMHGNLAQDLVGKMRYVRVGHDRSVW